MLRHVLVIFLVVVQSHAQGPGLSDGTIWQNPEKTASNPGQAGQNPNPGSVNQNPGQSNPNSGQGGQNQNSNPGQGSPSPAQANPNPEGAVQAPPGTGNGTEWHSVQAHDHQTGSSDQAPTQNPGQAGQNPNPGSSDQNPGQSNPSAGETAQNPVQGTVNPTQVFGQANPRHSITTSAPAPAAAAPGPGSGPGPAPAPPPPVAQGGQLPNDNYECKCHPAPDNTDSVNPTLACTCKAKSGATGANTNPENPGSANPASSSSAGSDDSTSNVICVKRNALSITAKPDWDWLYQNGKETEVVPGKWSTLTCTYGSISPFVVQPATYLAVLNQCTQRGFDVAQPANHLLSGWYPFQVGTNITGYFRENKGFVYNSYDRMQDTPLDKC